MKQVDKEGLKFLEEVEGIRLEAYYDSGGLPTIGIGSTRMFGKPVQMGMTCTVEEAYDQCKQDLADVEETLSKVVGVPLTQNQVNALASFIYNIGITAFVKSTLLKKLNMKDYRGAADQFMRWNIDNGRVVPGLTNRRIKERSLFLR